VIQLLFREELVVTDLASDAVVLYFQILLAGILKINIVWACSFLSVFVNLDGAAHGFHHRPNVVRHIGHAVAGLVHPVAPDRHRHSIPANEVANAPARQCERLYQVSKVWLKMVASHCALAFKRP
jgi:hypothetical protein